MISMSSGVALYTAATPAHVSLLVSTQVKLCSIPLYVVPKSTPTISLSWIGTAFGMPSVAMVGWFALGLKAYGMLLPLALNAPLMLESFSSSALCYYMNI
jgi:hypothetical protein